MADTAKFRERKDRNQKLETRLPDLGYYVIVTDTKETEKNYFEGIKNRIPDNLKDRLVIKVEKAETTNLVKKAKGYAQKEPQYREPWIAFDRDQIKDFDQIILDAKNEGINVAWSNPCIEIWFYAYFGKMPVITESTICCTEFSKKYLLVTRHKYNKSDKDIYSKLLKYGDEKIAIAISERTLRKFESDCNKIPSEMHGASTMHLLIKEIGSKIGK